MLNEKRATEMLEIMCIGVLLCIVAIQFIFMRVLLRQLRDARREVASWKLAAESLREQISSW
jgi:hypothetical protein